MLLLLLTHSLLLQLAYSQKVLRPPRHADRIKAALGLSGCPPPPPFTTGTTSTNTTTAATATATAGGATYFVDAKSGKDSNAGTSAASPFRTLQRAAAAAKSGASVTLLGGATHYLNSTLSLTAANSVHKEIPHAAAAIDAFSIDHLAPGCSSL